MPDVMVLKLGGSVLTSTSAIGRAVDEVCRWRASGDRVIAVVSAFRGATDALERLAGSYGGPEGGAPSGFASAMLLSTGELQSAALLSLPLSRRGVASDPADDAAIGLRVVGPALDASPTSVDRSAIGALLAGTEVLVVPGFVGRDDAGRRCLLGRGGSDLTALCIAAALDNARCRLVKDVDGLYESDPKRSARVRRYASLHYDDALCLDASIVQHKAIAFARDRGLRFEVGGVGRSGGTRIGAVPTVLEGDYDRGACQTQDQSMGATHPDRTTRHAPIP